MFKSSGICHFGEKVVNEDTIDDFSYVVVQGQHDKHDNKEYLKPQVIREFA